MAGATERGGGVVCVVAGAVVGGDAVAMRWMWSMPWAAEDAGRVVEPAAVQAAVAAFDGQRGVT